MCVFGIDFASAIFLLDFGTIYSDEVVYFWFYKNHNNLHRHDSESSQ